jgi:hypothetical protein
VNVLNTGSPDLIGSMLTIALSEEFEITALDARRYDHAPGVPTLVVEHSTRRNSTAGHL